MLEGAPSPGLELRGPGAPGTRPGLRARAARGARRHGAGEGPEGGARAKGGRGEARQCIGVAGRSPTKAFYGMEFTGAKPCFGFTGRAALRKTEPRSGRGWRDRGQQRRRAPSARSCGPGEAWRLRARSRCACGGRSPASVVRGAAPALPRAGRGRGPGEGGGARPARAGRGGGARRSRCACAPARRRCRCAGRP